MKLPKWKSPRRAPKDAPLLAKVHSGQSTFSTVVLFIGNRWVDLSCPARRVRLLAWHCRVPSLDAR